MKKIVAFILYALFASLFLFDGFLSDGLKGMGLHLFPSKLAFSAELLSATVTLLMLIIYALNKHINIRVTYLFFFFFFLLHILVGLVFNTVSSGAIFAGIRRYFVYMPLFFLPMVYKFSDREIIAQLKILLFFGLIQCPLAVYQRFFLFKHHVTGDFITGTFEISSIMSLYQIFCITILTAFYLRQKIKLKLFLFLSLILFIPTTLNETKGTLVLFPIAITLVILFGTKQIINLKKMILIPMSALMMGLIFIPLYSYLYPQLEIFEFFKGEGGIRGRTVQGYLYKDVAKEDLEDTEPGRIDVLLFPFEVLSKQPFKLIIGLGMGNVNPSGIKMFSGEYTNLRKYRTQSLTAASLVWEIGLIGLFMNFLFLWLVLKDSMAIRRIEGATAIMAAGWIGVVVLLGLSIVYKNAYHQNVIIYLFWYLSGVIAAKRANILMDKSETKLPDGSIAKNTP